MLVTDKVFSSYVNVLILLVCIASVVIAFVRVCIKHTPRSPCLPLSESFHGCHLLSEMLLPPPPCDKDSTFACHPSQWHVPDNV